MLFRASAQHDEGNAIFSCTISMCFLKPLFYDERFNVIQNIRKLYDPGSNSKERVSRKLRFDGQVEKELTLQETGTGNHSVENIYSYDHGDRLLSTRYIVKKGNDTKKDITLAANRYDALRQLKNKFLHDNGSENSFREQLDYSYVPCSWLSKVMGKTGAGIILVWSSNMPIRLMQARSTMAILLRCSGDGVL